MADNVLSKASSNYKTKKSLASGKYDGAILYMAPAKLAGCGNVCPFASAGCKAGCLYTAGQGRYGNVKAGRIRKTRLFFENRALFFATLHRDITATVRRVRKAGKTPFIRLNGTSDIDYGKFKVYNGKNVFQEFSDITFYDYTKSIKKLLENREPNYTLTFSRSECNEKECRQALAAGFNIAAVFSHKEDLPKTYLGKPVYDGDKEDLQFLYPKEMVIGLRAKGMAKADKHGFVVKADSVAIAA